LGERDRPAKIGFGQFGLAYFEPQVSATGQGIGPVDKFLGVRLERLVDGDEGIVDLAVDTLGQFPRFLVTGARQVPSAY
jgi:hypothetical protein